ncbi:hypothetical protein Krac_10133 [Ktedonobacter racemifer DSM 44963]|uniref:RING-type domain-containing protein n=1 Tax=Ktedonobacter racemifer DSM 44963 TaxID=485913 RepID=D6TFH0_KTERA|nr:hypothetical protein Krac_10133 [Ktedonobacter racemifer DSM 44963]
MKLMHNEKSCTLCNASLGWWNTQSCVKCGHTICNRHACKMRRPHSSVLFSYCPHCSPKTQATPHTQTVTPLEVEALHYSHA